MQSYSQSSGLHGVGDNRLKLICGCFKDIGGEEVAAANARRLAACWNACDGIPSDRLALLNVPNIIALVAERDGLRADIQSIEANYEAARKLLGEVEHARFDTAEWVDDSPDKLIARIRAFLKGGK